MSSPAIGIKYGDWTAFCQVCGRKFFGSTMRTRWDNLFVCDEDYEIRNPADRPPPVHAEKRNPPRVSTSPLTDDFFSVEQANPDDPMENWFNNGQYMGNW